MVVCTGTGPTNFEDSCVRGAWSSIPAAVVVAVLCINLIPIPLSPTARVVREALISPFKPFLTITEAEALDEKAAADGALAGDEAEDGAIEGKAKGMACWYTVLFVTLGLAETLAWFGIGLYRLIVDKNSYGVWQAYLSAFAWMYTTIRPIAHLSPTPPFDLFTVYSLHLFGGVIELGGVFYDQTVFGSPVPSGAVMVALTMNLMIITALLTAVYSMPLAIPSSRIKEGEIVRSSLLIKYRLLIVSF
jgi:hypothetical protein